RVEQGGGGGVEGGGEGGEVGPTNRGDGLEAAFVDAAGCQSLVEAALLPADPEHAPDQPAALGCQPDRAADQTDPNDRERRDAGLVGLRHARYHRCGGPSAWRGHIPACRPRLTPSGCWWTY